MCAAATIWLLPAASSGRGADLQGVDNVLTSTTQKLGAAVQQAVAPTREALKSTGAKTKSALQQTKRSTAKAGERATRATATDPATEPPMHGTNPHGQGGVAVVDLNPSAERPLGADPDGSDSGPEEVVVGRARGEQTASGNYHGHITILALFGNELAGVDTNEGETKNGPLQPVQTGILDPLCTATGDQVCLSVLTANSTTTASGSQNDFAIARARALGLGVGAAESGGTIGETADCQNALGGARTANVVTAGGPVAAAANSSVTSQSCRGQAPQTTASSQVIELGGNGIPLPAAGCANGTPDTVVEIPLLAKIVCNAADAAGAAVVREALDVFALNAGATSLVKETTAAAEANTVAPSGPEGGAPACSDGIDNDGDGLIDIADPGCHTDGNPNNPDSFNPSDTSEANPTGTGGSGDAGEGAGRPECSDNRDNDNDGLIDERDPGCHTDGNANNPASYDPDDTSEIDTVPDGAGSGAAGARTADAGALPFTGTNVVGLTLAGLLLLAGGLLLRRREGMRTSA
ncbi:MAG: LPXTG cell wall anchor domain-containing protein [Thermoleophilia bacterium]